MTNSVFVIDGDQVLAEKSLDALQITDVSARHANSDVSLRYATTRGGGESDYPCNTAYWGLVVLLKGNGKKTMSYGGTIV